MIAWVRIRVGVRVGVRVPLNLYYNIRRRKLIGDYIPYRRLIVYYAVFEREGVVCEWL